MRSLYSQFFYYLLIFHRQHQHHKWRIKNAYKKKITSRQQWQSTAIVYVNNVHICNQHEHFSRYSPLMPNNERQRIFSVEGVHVSHDYFCNNKSCTIHLDNLHYDTSGHYRCEVSGDAPEFKLVHDGNNMSIVGE